MDEKASVDDGLTADKNVPDIPFEVPYDLIYTNSSVRDEDTLVDLCVEQLRQLLSDLYKVVEDSAAKGK